MALGATTRDHGKKGRGAAHRSVLDFPRSPGLRRSSSLRFLAVLLVAIGGMGRAAMGNEPVLHVESNPEGEIEIEARGAAIEHVLGALASEAGFEVVMENGIVRPPVNVAASTAPVEDTLRRVLHGRNYALVYGEGGESLSQVIVLKPPSPRKPGHVSRPAGGRRPAVRRR